MGYLGSLLGELLELPWRPQAPQGRSKSRKGQNMMETMKAGGTPEQPPRIKIPWSTPNGLPGGLLGELLELPWRNQGPQGRAKSSQIEPIGTQKPILGNPSDTFVTNR